jgi:hypothetical protein
MDPALLPSTGKMALTYGENAMSFRPPPQQAGKGRQHQMAELSNLLKKKDKSRIQLFGF